MQKTISKNINITIRLNYSEICNLLKGGLAHTDIHRTDFIYDRCLDDIEDGNINNLQICFKIEDEALKHLEFMKAYLQQKEKNEIKCA